MKDIIPQETVEQRIFLIRGHKVMIDRDLAELYGVETKYLNRQVRRNHERFPREFMFRLTRQERDQLVSICPRLRNGVRPHFCANCINIRPDPMAHRCQNVKHRPHVLSQSV